MNTNAVSTAPGSVYAPPAARTGTTRRITSLDIIRGAVMVLMAIDHVRVYAGVPAGGPEPGIFLTRWITHFCAPAFVFLAGTAAFLHGHQLGDQRKLARYLLTRGLLLVFLEMTVIRFSWAFNVGTDFMLAGVIWMLGWCMVLMAGLVRFSPKTVGWLGLGIVFFQQVFGIPPRLLPEGLQAPIGAFWQFIYTTGFEVSSPISVLYVLVPWIGVMAAGYGFGVIIVRDPQDRNRLCLRIGLAATALFLVAGTAVVVLSGGSGDMDGQPGDQMPFLFRLLNQQKYPASQLYLLMTLGPTIALIPFADRARGFIADALDTIGRVPLFYYLLHIPLIHVSALIVNQLRIGSSGQAWYSTAPFAQVPPEHRWTLAMLYLVFAIDVVLLYFACRWYARVKAERPRNWMRYI